MSKTLFGALSLRSSKFYWKEADKGNSANFISFLHQLRQSHKDKTLILILDNGSIHRSKKVQKFLKKHSWVKLYFLPPYAPEYNPIERFWKWLKKKIYGCKSFINIKTLIQAVRKLIWHYHENNLVSGIQFNYAAHKEIR